MSTRVKHGVKIPGIYTRQNLGTGQLCLCGRVIIKAARVLGLEIGFMALGIKRRLATKWGRQRNLHSRILEAVVRAGKFFQPEAGLLPGVTELIMRC